jgi:hypothetical protein
MLLWVIEARLQPLDRLSQDSQLAERLGAIDEFRLRELTPKPVLDISWFFTRYPGLGIGQSPSLCLLNPRIIGCACAGAKCDKQHSRCATVQVHYAP